LFVWLFVCLFARRGPDKDTTRGLVEERVRERGRTEVEMSELAVGVCLVVCCTCFVVCVCVSEGWLVVGGWCVFDSRNGVALWHYGVKSFLHK
jgi:hypothetical protein